MTHDVAIAAFSKLAACRLVDETANRAPLAYDLSLTAASDGMLERTYEISVRQGSKAYQAGGAGPDDWRLVLDVAAEFGLRADIDYSAMVLR